MTVVLDRNASVGTADFGRRWRMTNGDTATTTTTKVGSRSDFFLCFFSFLTVSPDLKIWCMEIVSEGLLFIEKKFQSLGDCEMVHGCAYFV